MRLTHCSAEFCTIKEWMETVSKGKRYPWGCASRGFGRPRLVLLLRYLLFSCIPFLFLFLLLFLFLFLLLLLLLLLLPRKCRSDVALL